MAELAIRAEGLEKRFGETQALCGLDLEVEAATLFAVLGPNGAGKTTAVRILATLLRPDAGRAEVAGLDVVRDAAELRTRIGLAGQYAAVDEYLTGRENLELVGRLYGLRKRLARARADELLERFELVDAGSRTVKTYSGGMRRRLDLAASLIVAPPVIFLDEPTTGLDPRSRLGTWDLISELVSGGSTVLLTTQYLEEADQLADRIAVVDHGQAIARGTADELKAQVGGERIDAVVATPDQLSIVVEALARHGDGEPQVEADRGRATVPVSRGVQQLGEVVRDLEAAGVDPAELGLRRPTLDDVFLALTGHAADDAVEAADSPDGRARAGERTRKVA